MTSLNDKLQAFKGHVPESAIKVFDDQMSSLTVRGNNLLILYYPYTNLL